MISLTINGEKHQFEHAMNVTHLLAALKIDTQKVALEKNKTIVSRSQYDQTVINDGDILEIIAFVGGG